MTMTTEKPLNLAELSRIAFSNEAAAVELMTRLRWPSGVVCPKCGGADPWKLTPNAQPGRPARKGLYKCSQCRQQFSVTTGTVFEASHVPLSKWLMAIHLMSASKKGLSAAASNAGSDVPVVVDCATGVHRSGESRPYRSWAGDDAGMKGSDDFDLATTRRHVVTVTALAQYLAVDRRTILRMIAAGELEALKVGRAWRIPADHARAVFHVAHTQAS